MLQTTETLLKPGRFVTAKLPARKDSSGNAVGYYYFWSNETGYVQIPVMRTIIEEIKQ